MPVFDQLLRFVPIYKTRVWGGRALETLFGRELPDGQPYGESWELVDRPEAESVVLSGPLAGTPLHSIWKDHQREVFGPAVRRPDAPRFPVLIKVLDCRDDLSIQVHPPAAVAPSLGGEPKTEMWFVADAAAGARIYAGVRSGVTRSQFEAALGDGTVADCVHQLSPRTGDSLFVPSGRIHALGAGLVVFEIQQNSDTTYRVFDWNRVGLDGQPRALHIRESLASIDFTDVEPALGGDRGVLASCDEFRVTRARTGDPAPPGIGRLIMPIAATMWAGTTLRPGEVTLCPASARLPPPEGEWLEIEY
jgi:mannose-6-phosphate isomerase